MKLILSIKGQGFKETVRIYVQQCQDTTELMKEVCRRLQVSTNDAVIRLKVKDTMVRMIGGWPLSHYQMSSGKVLYVHLPTQPLMHSMLVQNDQTSNSVQLSAVKQLSASGQQSECQQRQRKLERDLACFLSKVASGTLEEVKEWIEKSLQGSYAKQLSEERKEFLLSEVGKDGKNAMHLAVMRMNAPLIRFLLEREATTDCLYDDMTLLMLAAERNSVETIKILLDHSEVDINEITSIGSALHVAALNGHTQPIEYLLKRNINTALLDDASQTADEVALDHKCREMIMHWKLTNDINDKVQLHPGVVKGRIWLVKRYIYLLNQLTMIVDGVSNKISLYSDDSKLVAQNLKLELELQSLKMCCLVDQYKWWMDHKFIYIKLKFQDSTRYIAVKNSTAALKWLNCLSFSMNTQNEGAVEVSYDRNSEMIINPEFGTFNIKHNNPMQNVKLRKKVSLRDYQEKYRLIRQIGEGAFAKVHLVAEKRTQLNFAVKVLNKKRLLKQGSLDYAYSELAIVQKLRHEHIVHFIQSFESRHYLHMVLEYCPYGDLRQYISENKLTEKQSRNLIAQVVLAINYLHNQEILYRDLKPENILISERGFLKLTDFGLSKVSVRKMEAATFCGSPVYTCPELLEGKPFTKKSDIYGIGCLLYEMATGDPPFLGTNLHHLYQNIKRGNYTPPLKSSSQLRDLIKSLLNVNPERRPSIQEIKQHAFFKELNWSKLGPIDTNKLRVRTNIQYSEDDEQY